MTTKEILQHDSKFRYQLLSRMQQDCEYYLGFGSRNKKHLWAGNEKEHIEIMLVIYKSFPLLKKPKWCKKKQILKYKKAML